MLVINNIFSFFRIFKFFGQLFQFFFQYKPELGYYEHKKKKNAIPVQQFSSQMLTNKQEFIFINIDFFKYLPS